MTVYQQIFFVISVSSTVILIIQTILAIVGIAGHSETDLSGSHIPDDIGIDAADGGDFDVDIDIDVDADIDVDLHIDHDHSLFDVDNISDKSAAHSFDVHGLRLFTVRGIMAFLMVGSWVGFLLSKSGVNEILATVFALISGLISLVFMAKIMQLLMTLQADGTTKVKNALGQTGQVYIRIPGEEKGMGKVNVTVQEKLCEFDAVTEKSEMIKTGEMVYVTDIRAGNVLVVEKIEEE